MASKILLSFKRLDAVFLRTIEVAIDEIRNLTFITDVACVVCIVATTLVRPLVNEKCLQSGEQLRDFPLGGLR